MSKSKCNVRVKSSNGSSYTTRRGARRLVDRGLARPVSDTLVEMIETDHRFDCAPVSANPPRLFVVSQRSLDSGRYRNDVLGLPNFVGIQKPRRTAGRIAA